MLFLPDATFVLIIPAMIFALWAQSRVQSTYQRYSRVAARSGVTGARVARKLLDDAGLTNVAVEIGKGHLTDHYDPRRRVVRLSPGVHQSNSLAALGIAAHEAGHAIQHGDAYIPLAFRNNIFPVASIGTHMAFPLFFVGLIFAQGGLGWLMDLGILFFAFAVVFQLVTLPVEFNASNRAVALLEGAGYLSRDEVAPTRQVLNAAALTYIAATAVAVSQLIRLILLRNMGQRD
ncbi:MAG: zinc metallopeptidase [Dethiobacter sp.]|nr:zinc metallopeptidase [Dethiobacter sp.]MCL5981342.1 zinc metallopeptidase [Bacillota bacterium]